MDLRLPAPRRRIRYCSPSAMRSSNTCTGRRVDLTFSGYDGRSRRRESAATWGCPISPISPDCMSRVVPAPSVRCSTSTNVYRYTHGDSRWASVLVARSAPQEPVRRRRGRGPPETSGFGAYVMFCCRSAGDRQQVPVTMGFYATCEAMGRRSEAEHHVGAEPLGFRRAATSSSSNRLLWKLTEPPGRLPIGIAMCVAVDVVEVEHRTDGAGTTLDIQSGDIGEI